MDSIVGKEIEFKNARKDTTQIGIVLDVILYKEKNTDLSPVTGYLVKILTDLTTRVVKPIRVTKVLGDDRIEVTEAELKCNICGSTSLQLLSPK
jgi:hypothetical protein